MLKTPKNICMSNLNFIVAYKCCIKSRTSCNLKNIEWKSYMRLLLCLQQRLKLNKIVALALIKTKYVVPTEVSMEFIWN